MAFVAASESENALRAVDTDADTKRDRDVAKYLERLGDVAARPLGDLELRLPVFDLMATTFAPLARPHPMALEPFEGTEAEDAPDSPDPAASCSDVALLDGVWAEPIRTDILHRVVNWQRAKRRLTAYRGKTYSEKSGSGRKPFSQKGTGMARQGNKRAPIHRGGVKAHAPVLRDWSFKLNKAVRRKGLRVALSAKLADDKVIIVGRASAFTSSKTEDLSRRLEAVARASGIGDIAPAGGLASTTLFVVSERELTPQLRIAAKNLQRVELVPQLGCTVYDILRRDVLMISPDALEELQARLLR